MHLPNREEEEEEEEEGTNSLKKFWKEHVHERVSLKTSLLYTYKARLLILTCYQFDNQTTSNLHDSLRSVVLCSSGNGNFLCATSWVYLKRQIYTTSCFVLYLSYLLLMESGEKFYLLSCELEKKILPEFISLVTQSVNRHLQYICTYICSPSILSLRTPGQYIQESILVQHWNGIYFFHLDDGMRTDGWND